MGTKRQSTNKLRHVLRAALFVILCLSFAASISGESAGESRKPSNGLIAFADAPEQRPGPHTRENAQIYTITPDGRNRKQLTTGKPGNLFPAWSPKGDKIAYWSGDARGFGQVWVMRSDGTHPRQLTHSVKSEYTPDGSSANAPAWLFSKRIACWSGIEHRYGQIWTMNADGSDQRVLVSDVKVIPMRTSWQPVFSVESSNKTDPGDGK
ncbi:MAG: TolB family protein [Acidobacteriota bacterium]